MLTEAKRTCLDYESFDKIYQIHHFQPERRPHDYSKDSLFYFVLCSYFDGDVQSKLMKILFGQEIKRHHSLNKHHPETIEQMLHG